MLAVIFEVQPKPAEFDRYLEVAAALRPALERIDGFVAIERFASRSRSGRVLSLSLWRDEAAVARWRTFAAHRAAQELGRAEIFADYRLRVGEITADSAAAGSAAETGMAAGNVTILEWLSPAVGGPVDCGIAGQADILSAEEFDSLYVEGRRLLLAAWRDDAAAALWRPPGSGWRQSRVRIVRDYGMFERDEAPQYQPPVPRQAVR